MATLHPIQTIINDMKAVCGPAMSGTLKRLEVEAEKLTTEIETLKLCGADPAIPSQWDTLGLTKTEAKICRALERAGNAGLTHEALLAQVNSGRSMDEWPDPECLKVLVFRIRKLFVQGNVDYWIETRAGVGYALHKGQSPKALGKPGTVGRWNLSYAKRLGRV